MSTKYCPSSMAPLILPSLHGHIIGRIQTGNSSLTLLHGCCIAFSNKLKSRLGRLYVINIEYFSVITWFLYVSCRICCRWEKIEVSLGAALDYTENIASARIKKIELYFCECNFFTAALEAVVYSVAVYFSTETGICWKKMEMWLYDYKSHRFSSEGYW